MSGFCDGRHFLAEECTTEIISFFGKCCFKAKREHYEYIMYFYSVDRYHGFWKTMASASVIPKLCVDQKRDKD